MINLAAVLAMSAFHRDAPLVARRPWLLALAAGYLLVYGPVLALQATGNTAWLPDFSGDEQTTATEEVDPGHAVPAPAAPVVRPGQRAGHGPDAYRCRLHRPGHLTPLGPYSAATMPQPHHLRSPFVLQAMRAQPLMPAGGCPAGYVALSGVTAAGQCYRKTGTPVTITSAAVSPVPSYQAKPFPGQAGPAQYGLLITMPATDVPALTAVNTTAYKARGALAISIAGRTWVLPTLGGPWASQQLGIFLPRNQALRIQRLLASSG